MEYIKQATSYLKQLITQPIGELNRAQRFMRLCADMTRHCAQALRQDKATQMAAALTYHTLFSLLPTMVLAMVILNAFVGVEQRDDFKESIVNILFPKENIEQAALRDPKRFAQLTQARNELTQTVEERIDSVSEVSLGGVGIVGLLVFIFAATALLATAERSFNSILGAASNRPFYLRMPLYYTVITIAPLVFLAGQYSQGKMLDLLESGRWSAWLIGPVAVMLPILATWLVLFGLFKFLPNTTVKKRAAATGSFVSTILWVVLKNLFFKFYVANAAVTSLYGALALLPLFLLWLYLTWIIILFGLEITATLAALQGRRLESFEYQRRADLLKYGNPQWMIPIMARIGQAFETGKTLSRIELADELELPISAVAQLTDRLATEGLIHQVVTRGDKQAQLSLAKPPDKIAIASLLELIETLTFDANSPGRNESWEHLEQLNSAKLNAVTDSTLASWLDGHDGQDAD